KPRHPDAFYGMMKVTAANLAHDYFRRPRPPMTDVDPFIPDSHSGPASIEREILLREIDDILSEMATPLAARDREIFWLYYRQGFTAQAIAAIPCYKLTTKGVESILYRLTCYVRERLVEKKLNAPKPKARSEGIPPPNTLNTSEGQL
ncbi:MAG TPA: sigma-70 family RNA polymerase sigma factor, partial [Candidatus Angelobacter sp.]|nr:sigma-70 family RNA polymerase sigma factor [Candidatus Angelobacter sp.]